MIKQLKKLREESWRQKGEGDKVLIGRKARKDKRIRNSFFRKGNTFCQRNRGKERERTPAGQ